MTFIFTFMLCVNIMGELGLRLTSDELIRVDTADRNVTWWIGVGLSADRSWDSVDRSGTLETKVGLCPLEWDFAGWSGIRWTGVGFFTPKHREIRLRVTKPSRLF